MLNEDHRYNITLSDGSSWSIAFDQQSEDFARKLADILHLTVAKSNIPASYTIHIRNVPPDKRISPTNGFRPLLETLSLSLFMSGDGKAFYCDVDIEYATRCEEQYACMCKLLFPIYLRTILVGGMPVHSALASFRERGVLIAAPGGTGKSTSVRRLPPHWRALCDDESLIIKADARNYRVHPFPTWSDHLLQRGSIRSHLQASLPLSALFFLEQAHFDAVVPLQPGKAAMLLYKAGMEVCSKYLNGMHPSTSRKDIARSIFENAIYIAQSVSAYRLQATLDGVFWTEMERVLETFHSQTS